MVFYSFRGWFCNYQTINKANTIIKESLLFIKVLLLRRLFICILWSGQFRGSRSISWMEVAIRSTLLVKLDATQLTSKDVFITKRWRFPVFFIRRRLGAPFIVTQDYRRADPTHTFVIPNPKCFVDQNIRRFSHCLLIIQRCNLYATQPAFI